MQIRSRGSAIVRRPAGASGKLSHTGIGGIARRTAGAGGITTAWGNSESGGRGISVQTVVVPRILNLKKGITARGNSSIVIPDEEELGPTGDIDSPIEANSTDIGAKDGAIDTIKWALTPEG